VVLFRLSIGTGVRNRLAGTTTDRNSKQKLAKNSAKAGKQTSNQLSILVPP
jgi:hypothetical protein